MRAEASGNAEVGKELSFNMKCHSRNQMRYIGMHKPNVNIHARLLRFYTFAQNF